VRRIPFNVALAAIALAGFGARLLYIELGALDRGPGDSTWYHLMANAVADGHGFTLPLAGVLGSGPLEDYSGATVPTALHPPLFPSLLAVFSKLGLTGYGDQRVIGCALGAATVAVIGLIGRRAGGRVLGLVAAALAAVYLPLIANEAVMMSESLFGLTIAVTILTALRYTDAPSAGRAAALGAAIGAAILTRSESVLLLVLLVPFAARRAGARPLREGVVAAAVAVLVIAPWCVRNSLEFDRVAGVTNGDGAALAGSNTPMTFFGGRMGTWDFGGLALDLPRRERTNEADDGVRLRAKGLRYARDHAGRLPQVIAARTGRTWYVYPFAPAAQVRYNALAEARRQGLEWATMVSAWAVTLLAIGGALVLRRRGVWLAPFISMVVMATVVSMLFYGGPRFREAADVALVVLAAASLLELRGARNGRAA
jgi:4-amino-4-deoxy-L-arabinose transferase-like glycosyltransferase